MRDGIPLTQRDIRLLRAKISSGFYDRLYRDEHGDAVLPEGFDLVALAENIEKSAVLYPDVLNIKYNKKGYPKTSAEKHCIKCGNLILGNQRYYCYSCRGGGKIE